MSNTIAGNVFAGGVGVVGATVSWTGTSSGSVTSGAGGAYTTSALGAGTYTLTCADTGYSFSTTLLQTIVATNLTGVNFMTNGEWIGQGDASGDWMDSDAFYLGPGTPLRLWIGQDDNSGDWMDSDGIYLGQPLGGPQWLGQSDALGDWMDSNGVYSSYVNFTPNPPFPPTPGGVQPPLFAGWYGLTWLKNIAVLTRDYWDESLTTPYSGQLYPVPNTGGTQNGQIYPY
jgi:hypothetical protein